MVAGRRGACGPEPAAEGLSPLDAPVGYPGRPLRASGLLTGAGFAEQDQPITQSRHPVLAIGSNADPAQLRRKLGPLLHVPVTAVIVTGLAVAHSAHVAPPGYVPYAPRLLPGALPGEPGVLSGTPGVLEAVVLWLDDDALAVLDRTEPNYRRVPCPVPKGLPGGRCEVYRSRWGLLPASPGAAALPAGDQATAFRCLASRPWFAALVPGGPGGVRAAIGALRADPVRREEIRSRLAAEGPVDDGWPAMARPW